MGPNAFTSLSFYFSPISNRQGDVVPVTDGTFCFTHHMCITNDKGGYFLMNFMIQPMITFKTTLRIHQGRGQKAQYVAYSGDYQEIYNLAVSNLTYPFIKNFSSKVLNPAYFSIPFQSFSIKSNAYGHSIFLKGIRT